MTAHLSLAMSPLQCICEALSVTLCCHLLCIFFLVNSHRVGVACTCCVSTPIYAELHVTMS